MFYNTNLVLTSELPRFYGARNQKHDIFVMKCVISSNSFLNDPKGHQYSTKDLSSVHLGLIRMQQHRVSKSKKNWSGNMLMSDREVVGEGEVGGR